MYQEEDVKREGSSNVGKTHGKWKHTKNSCFAGKNHRKCGLINFTLLCLIVRRQHNKQSDYWPLLDTYWFQRNNGRWKSKRNLIKITLFFPIFPHSFHSLFTFLFIISQSNFVMLFIGSVPVSVQLFAPRLIKLWPWSKLFIC